ncbi:DUF11 domain-containing protein [Acinetobacter sp. SwsAc6]|uniref:DUF11 domain-containing protein n=1 Tax=Acinetobacter sp. SwsAc6 TaxID=2749439 RepID=UPI0015B928C3|nr:DUF11 domain-containing protein [Acinetobacter sp. SwsAc6]NWK74564.1 DUF11 domain-containing protein [Acinetobacter sp. SwsAc6]
MWGTELNYKQMKKQFGHIFATALALTTVNAYAIPTLEVMSASGTNRTGSTTTSKDTKFVFNPKNPTDNATQNYYPEVKVNYSILNNVYANGIVFGGDNIGDFVPLKSQGFPSSGYNNYSNSLSSSRASGDIGKGISLDDNYGVRFLTAFSKLDGKKWYTAGENSGMGYQMGDIVLTWDRPITNPVINISGVGGQYDYGIAAQFKLLTTTGVSSLGLLSGTNVSVNGWDIKHTGAYTNEIERDWWGSIIKNNLTIGPTIDDKGATGSIQVYTSAPITTLTFRVYFRTDASSSIRTDIPYNTGGDAFIFSASSIDSMVGDLLIEKTNNVTQVAKGSNTTYTVRVTNKGPDTFTGTFLNDRLAQGLELVKVECSTATNNKCTDSSKIDVAKLFVSDADLTSSAITGQDTGALAKDAFYEVLVTAKVTGDVGTTTLNKASVKLPTMGSSTGVACSNQTGVGGSTGLTRSFNKTLGICSVTDTDTIIKPIVDLAVSKTADKASYNVGETAVYTIKAWNTGMHAMPDAVLTDVIPSNLAPLNVSCKAVGLGVDGTALSCPTADKIILVNNQLTVKDMVLPKTTITGTNPVLPASYLEFTVTALANTAGTSIANTAKIAVPLVGGVATATETITANNSSTATIAIKAPYLFSGRVFNDNSGTTKVAANAYNGIVNAGELGISGSTVTLKNCSGTPEYASVQTNGNGDFEIRTFQEVFDVNNRVCLVQKNVADYQSVSTNKSASVTATTDSSFDLFTITKNANTYDGFLFGDAQLQLILTQNGQKNIAAGDVVEYPHEIISKSVHKLGTLNLSNQQQPAIDPVWQSLIYYDANCNGAVDAGEKSYELALQSAPLSAPILPEQKICLVQRVMSPSNAKAGDSLSAQFSVKHTPTMSAGVTSLSNSVRDITTVGSAGLDLVKSVREVKSCPSTSTDTATFVKSNILTKVQDKVSYLEYQISYTNNSAKNLVDVVLKDAVPLGTSLKSMCTGGDCTTVDSATPLSWNIAGVLAPRATGTVRFCAQVE